MRANLKPKQRACLLILVILLFTLGLPPRIAGAQNNTALTFDPDVVSVPLGNSVQLQLWVLEGVNLNAFDVELEYDADVLTLASWSYGDFLQQLAQVMLMVEPGYFRLAATQLAQPVVSGSGVLLNFTFNTAALGETPIDLINVQLSDAQGNSTFPALEDALVTVVSAPTYTPTVTPIPTLTNTPVWTATRASSATPTATAMSLPTETPMPSGTGLPTETPNTTWPGQVTQTPAWTESWSQPSGESPGQAPFAGEGGQSGETPFIGGNTGNYGGQTGSELALAPGYEQTAQVAHNATLMAQAEVLQAGTLTTNAQGSLESTLWIVLIAGLVILAGLLVVAVRRRQKL